MTTRLSLSLACNSYDRTAAIQEGSVQIEGVDLTWIPLRVEETFFRMLRHQEFDVAELSLSSYTLTLDGNDKPPFIALPVFPSRFFRHQSIYVSKQSGISQPSDLKGKRVGVPEFQMTAPVWQRGILEEHYGLPYDSVEYFTGAVEPSTEPRVEKLKLNLASSVKVTPIPAGKCLSQMLADGEIDALYSATQPSSFGVSPNVTHLFPDFKATEMDYYKKTGIFPIMHVLAIKRSLHEQHPWLARSITKAFNESLERSYDVVAERGALRYLLPWLQDHVEETKRAFGTDRWWTYGLKENYKTLDTFLDYHHRHMGTRRRLKPEDLFAKSACESFVL